jgi:hypothetical protein
VDPLSLFARKVSRKSELSITSTQNNTQELVDLTAIDERPISAPETATFEETPSKNVQEKEELPEPVKRKKHVDHVDVSGVVWQATRSISIHHSRWRDRALHGAREFKSFARDHFNFLLATIPYVFCDHKFYSEESRVDGVQYCNAVVRIRHCSDADPCDQ